MTQSIRNTSLGNQYKIIVLSRQYPHTVQIAVVFAQSHRTYRRQHPNVRLFLVAAKQMYADVCLHTEVTPVLLPMEPLDLFVSPSNSVHIERTCCPTDGIDDCTSVVPVHDVDVPRRMPLFQPWFCKHDNTNLLSCDVIFHDHCSAPLDVFDLSEQHILEQQLLVSLSLLAASLVKQPCGARGALPPQQPSNTHLRGAWRYSTTTTIKHTLAVSGALFHHNNHQTHTCGARGAIPPQQPSNTHLRGAGRYSTTTTIKHTLAGRGAHDPIIRTKTCNV